MLIAVRTVVKIHVPEVEPGDNFNRGPIHIIGFSIIVTNS